MSQPPFRTGQGYDVHRFAPGRRLVLGGVEIPHHEGLDGHSDADCLAHAVADAILGALGLPDIGTHFPPDDPSLEGIDSMEIVRKAVEECRAKGYKVGNVDATVIAEVPKIAPHVGPMKDRLSKVLGIQADCVGIKATTNEGIGGIGRGEGIATHVACLLLAERD